VKRPGFVWAIMPCNRRTADYGHAVWCGFAERCRRENLIPSVARFKHPERWVSLVVQVMLVANDRPVDTKRRGIEGQRWCTRW